MIEISAIGNKAAQEYLNVHSAYRGAFDIAICAKEGDTVHGVIVCCFDGNEFAKEHICTDGNAQIGSLLYGAMVRVAMALGYKTLTL